MKEIETCKCEGFSEIVKHAGELRLSAEWLGFTHLLQ